MNSINKSKIISDLCSLYDRHGFVQYKMNKFEEYDLYARNKDFLISEDIITFTDTNGKLMALKPDVTLSIIKNTKRTGYPVQKVYYDESVYRVSQKSGEFREIRQIGLESLGSLDSYLIYEVINLALESLKSITDDFCLEICDVSLVSTLLDSLFPDGRQIPFDKKQFIMKCMREKNTHDLQNFFKNEKLGEKLLEKLILLISTYGKPEDVLKKLTSGDCPAFSEDMTMNLKNLCGLLNDDRIRIDYSVINENGYYNGFIFKGYVKGLSDSILSGGQYDRLMSNMNRDAMAIGFAVYADMLDDISEPVSHNFDLDTLIVYKENTPVTRIAEVMRQVTSEGKRALAAAYIPDKITYGEMICI